MTATTLAPAAVRFALSIECSALVAPDGEVIEVAELVATDRTTGRAWAYIGPVLCGTQDEAARLHARIFEWERSTGKDFTPEGKPTLWALVAPGVADDGGEAAEVADGEWNPTPSVWGAGERNTVEVVEAVQAEAVPAKPRKARVRKVDAGKARRAAARARANNGIKRLIK